jgi:hypothetical protein
MDVWGDLLTQDGFMDKHEKYGRSRGIPPEVIFTTPSSTRSALGTRGRGDEHIIGLLTCSWVGFTQYLHYKIKGHTSHSRTDEFVGICE